MRAAWYERQGPARDVLVVGEMPDPAPGPGEVRIRVAASGINPGEVKKRVGWQGSAMPFPRVVPHSDGAGVIDAVGAGVAATRLGQKAWCYGAQSYRPFGTAADCVVVPEGLALELPAHADDAMLEQAACLGIPGITGFRAVFAVSSRVSGSTSANTGVAPACTTAAAVAVKVMAGTTTSSPEPTPRATSAKCSAAVHEFSASACGAPT